MSNIKECGFLAETHSVLIKALLATLLLAFASGAQQQNPPLLQITAPANGSVINPGQTISVTVTSPANASFTQVAVIGEDPIGLSNIATTVPAEIALTIPPDTSCGQIMLTAQGVTVSGQNTESAAILIDVERSDLPLSLSSPLLSLTLQETGEKAPLVILARFSDDNILDVSRSSYLTYASTNTSVATVDSNGVVTAVAAGSGFITVTYTLGTQSQTISIPVRISPLVITSPSVLTFGAQDVGFSSQPQTVTVNSVSNSAVNILGVSATGDFSQTNTCLSSSPLAPGAKCSISVTFTPTAVGATTGSVNLTDDATPATVTVALSGTGMSDFSISAAPPAQSVKIGGSTSYTISVSSIGGFTGAVALSVAGLPTAVTPTFSPTSINGGSGSSTLNIATSTKTPTGTSTLTITGTSGSLTHTVNTNLTVNPKR